MQTSYADFSRAVAAHLPEFNGIAFFEMRNATENGMHSAVLTFWVAQAMGTWPANTAVMGGKMDCATQEIAENEAAIDLWRLLVANAAFVLCEKPSCAVCALQKQHDTPDKHAPAVTMTGAQLLTLLEEQAALHGAQ
jgi:hypothetical protein